MIIFFILMFLFTIIAPFCYFHYIFRSQPLKYRMILGILSTLSLIIIMIKIFIHPDSSLFFISTVIVQFYILFLLISAILFIIYQLILKILHKSFSKRVMMVLAILGLCLTSLGYYSHYHKNIQKYSVLINKQSSLSELRVAMISDMHIGTGTYMNDIKELVYKLNQNNYDLVCFVGDLFDESTPQNMIEKTLKELSQIKTKYGMFAVNGNHEHYAQFLDADLYKQYNIHYLNENYVCVDGLFNIVGREDISAHSDISFEQTIQNMNKNLPTIVLDHNPKRYKEIIKDADLQLSGHTHGGQAFPLTLITAPLYDNVYGQLNKDNFSLIVTSGYGSWGFPFRLLTNCEYVDIKIQFLNG